METETEGGPDAYNHIIVSRIRNDLLLPQDLA